MQEDTDADLLVRLRAGDEQAFVILVRRHHATMLRLASGFVPNLAVAEEVVQDTWLGVLRGLDGFEGRSSVRTWLFRILMNRARSAGTRERRSVAIGDPGRAVDQSRFDAAGAWASPPEHWIEDADDRLHAAKLAARLRTAIDELPGRQREVVTLRDVEGLSSEEVCSALAISESNQRVLLHRGRSRLRQVLETEFGEGMTVHLMPRLPLLPRRRRDLVCQQAVELVTDYLEGTLSRAGRRRFESHLAGCPHCTEYLAQMRATIELTGRVTPEDLSPQMQDEFIALYRQWRADHDEDLS